MPRVYVYNSDGRIVYSIEPQAEATVSLSGSLTQTSSGSLVRINASFSMSGSSIQASSGTAYISAFVSFSGSATQTSSGSVAFDFESWRAIALENTDVEFDTVEANTFVGDGSGLTNVGAGDATTISKQAGENISALQVLVAVDGEVFVASSDEPDDAGRLCGVAVTAASSGNSVDVRIFGELTDSGWSWSPGPVYLGLNGALTQSVPTSGFIAQIGVALDSDSILISIKQPIRRS